MRAKRSAGAAAFFAAIGVVALGGFHVQQAKAQRLKAELVTSDVTLPTWVGMEPGDPSRIFIIERGTGQIKIYKDGQILPLPFLDIADHLRSRGDGGFMSMTFHPDFANNHLFYIYYTNSNGDAVVDQYQVSSDPNIADASSRFEIIKILRDPSDDLHAGGFIDFGPTDGYLYITCGDAGPQGDPNHHAQNPQLMLGKILRIDVNTGARYGIPEDNPFVNDPTTLDEIWAIGFRNPWRATIDSQTGDLYIGDVGFGTWEEVDYIANGDGGKNYGWAIKEGNHCFSPPNNCDPNGLLTNPITEYQHQSNPRRCSIIGGVVYRGDSMPLLDGHYFYGDFCSGEVFSLKYDGNQIVETKQFADQLHQANGTHFAGISTFGTDLDGEMFVVDLLTGVYRIKTEMHLEVPELTAGQQAHLTLTGGAPNARAMILYSTRGTGPTEIVQYGLTLAIRAPMIAGSVTTNSDGVATLGGTLPPGTAGRTLWFQAAQIGNTSDVSRRVVQ